MRATQKERRALWLFLHCFAIAEMKAVFLSSYAGNFFFLGFSKSALLTLLGHCILAS